MTQPLRVVPDTNVLIFALISQGTPRTILDLCRGHCILPVTSDAILAELAGVLRRKFNWEGWQVNVVLEELRSVALVLVPAKTVQCITEDPADNCVLECALEAQADYIVTGDTRHVQPLGSFEGIPILSPVAFVDEFGESG